MGLSPFPGFTNPRSIVAAATELTVATTLPGQLNCGVHIILEQTSAGSFVATMDQAAQTSQGGLRLLSDSSTNREPVNDVCTTCSSVGDQPSGQSPTCGSPSRDRRKISKRRNDSWWRMLLKDKMKKEVLTWRAHL